MHLDSRMLVANRSSLVSSVVEEVPSNHLIRITNLDNRLSVQLQEVLQMINQTCLQEVQINRITQVVQDSSPDLAHKDFNRASCLLKQPRISVQVNSQKQENELQTTCILWWQIFGSIIKIKKIFLFCFNNYDMLI